jgi:hypothetical protein
MGRSFKLKQSNRANNKYTSCFVFGNDFVTASHAFGLLHGSLNLPSIPTWSAICK